MNRVFPLLILLTALSLAIPAEAAIVGTNGAAVPLTPDRVAALPEWKAYLERSIRFRDLDRKVFQEELSKAGTNAPSFPALSSSAKSIDLSRPKEWYGGAEPLRIASVIVSFQTPAGGWCKNTDFSKDARHPGEFYGATKAAAPAAREGKTSASDPGWDFVGTFDNDGTTTQLNFLAKVITARQGGDKMLEASFCKGIEYILSSQYPNGGWPQVWPLEGGYHDAVTFNDGAMQHVIDLLRLVSEGSTEYAFVPADLRKKVGVAWKHGMECILKCQISVGGRPTVWCQQYDPLTLEPCPARNYEMPALCSAESASLVISLMNIPDPDPKIIRAVGDAVRWFEASKIIGKEFLPGPDGRLLRDSIDPRPIWARYYAIDSGKPVFGDRDHTIHDDLSGISRERRDGYAWFVTTPRKVLDRYPDWAARNHSVQ